MTYTKKIFNKEIDELLISDLNIFFETEQEETSVLEFKSGKVEINNIYKEVAAFLNTEGGLLIIGSPLESKRKIGKTEITFCNGKLTHSKFRNKDWLYQKISSNIVPAPTGIKIFEYLEENGSIFVIDIPQSTIPPHQTSTDGKYYIRLEREAKHAPHGIVQALFQKRRLPRLSANLRIIKEEELVSDVHVSIHNLSNIPADKVGYIVEVYNVEEIEDEYFQISKDVLGEKYYLSQNSTSVLVRVISIPINFKLIHREKEYLIFVGFWSKDTDFDFIFWRYNPILDKIELEGRFEDGKSNFLDELERLDK